MGETVELSEVLVDSYYEEVRGMLVGECELDMPELAIALARIAGELAPPIYIVRLIQEVDGGEE